MPIQKKVKVLINRFNNNLEIITFKMRKKV